MPAIRWLSGAPSGRNGRSISPRNCWPTIRAGSLATQIPKTLVATGEMLLVCPAGHGSFYRYVKDQPLGAVFPEGPIVANRDVLIAPIKGAANPNAALLLTGWVASKGVTLMRTGRESVFHPGSEGEQGGDVNAYGS